GGTLGLAVMVLAPLTGAGFNPARSFGPALVAGKWGESGAAGGAGGGFLDFVVPFVIGPLVGGLLAAFVYFSIFIQPGKKGPGGMEPVG
ncbi:MAG TPA: aquaporin, partial [Thermoleophilaceae bacterium]